MNSLTGTESSSPTHGTSQDQQEVKGGKGGRLGPPRPPPGWRVRRALPHCVGVSLLSPSFFIPRCASHAFILILSFLL